MKKRKLLLLGLLCSCVCSVALGVNLAKADSDSTITINDTFSQKYELGEELNLLGGFVVDDGETYSLETVVTYPSGTQTKYSNVSLTEVGEYKVEYFYKVGNETIFVETKTFSVVITPTNLFRTTGNASLEANVDTKSYAYHQGNGVELTFTSNTDTVVFSQPIDFSDNTKDQTFVELLPSPELEGVAEMTFFNIRLYDMNDPTIWVNFTFEASAWGYEQNLMLQLSTNTMEGTTIANSWTYGEEAAIKNGINPWQGASAMHLGRCGVYGKVNNVRSMNTRLYYDASENAFYVRNYHDYQLDGFLTCIVDLDNLEHVSEKYVWNGFPSGKAYMEISTTPTQEAHMLIFSVDGKIVSGESIQGDYQTTIDVKFPQTKFNGVVGAKYPVFEASASDSYGNIYNHLDVSVYTVSETEGKKKYHYYPVKNGLFDTPVEGTYIIEYSFVDFNGNKQRKKVEVTVGEEEKALRYLPNAQMQTSYTVGQRVFLLDGEVEGAIGKYTVGKEVLFTADGASKAEKLETTDYGNGGFVRFDKAGTCQIKVTVIDELGRTFEEIAYEFALVYPTGVVINTPSLPVSVFKGETFVIPAVSAHEYKNGQKTGASVSVFVNNENVTQTMQYTPTTTDTITVSYRTENNVVLFEKDVLVKEKRAEIYADNFFSFENMTATCVTSDAGVEYRLSAVQAGNAKALFSRKISVNTLSATLDAIQGYEADEICVRFIDSQNADQSIACTLKKGLRAGEVVLELYLNGSTERAGIMAGSIDGTGTDLIKVQYEADLFAISDCMGDVVAKISTYENGELFQGFSSGYAYIEVEFIGVDESYQIVYTAISNQAFTNAPTDTTSPSLIFKDDVSIKIVQLGDVVYAEKPIYADVYSDRLTLKASISFTKANGEKVLIAQGDADSIDLTLRCNEVGIYVITWTCSDGRNEMEVRKSFEILDREAPTLKLDSALKERYSVGEKVNLPTATVKGDGDYFVVIEEVATGKVITCKKYEKDDEKDKNEFFFTFQRAGEYKIVYIAYDISMNRTEYEFNVLVK